jgi:hypothetical protein
MSEMGILRQLSGWSTAAILPACTKCCSPQAVVAFSLFRLP